MVIRFRSHAAYQSGCIIVAIPAYAETTVKVFLEKHGGRALSFQVSTLVKMRSTGRKSQNHHINGHIQQISMETGNDFDTVKMYCKYEAINRGYPFDSIKDKVIPWSETRISTVQAGYLIDTIHQVAAELRIILQEEN